MLIIICSVTCLITLSFIVHLAMSNSDNNCYVMLSIYFVSKHSFKYLRIHALTRLYPCFVQACFDEGPLGRPQTMVHTGRGTNGRRAGLVPALQIPGARLVGTLQRSNPLQQCYVIHTSDSGQDWIVPLYFIVFCIYLKYKFLRILYSKSEMSVQTSYIVYLYMLKLRRHDYTRTEHNIDQVVRKTLPIKKLTHCRKM